MSWFVCLCSFVFSPPSATAESTNHTTPSKTRITRHTDFTCDNVLFIMWPIVLDRLRGFQESEFKCRENALAITKLEEAMHWLHHRTRARVARGVEGTNTP